MKKQNGHTNGSIRLMPEVNSSANYARCYAEDLLVMLPTGQPTHEMKKEPEKWALYYLPEGCNPRFHVIGEDSDHYALRNLIARTTGSVKRTFSAMWATWQRNVPRDREYVRQKYFEMERG